MKGFPLTPDERITELEKKVLPLVEFAGEDTEKGKEINRSLKGKGFSKGEELAIIRKAVRYLIQKHGDDADPELSEFINYFDTVEETKAEYRLSLEQKER